ncbi:putative membrane protein [Sphingomonas naasensis]|uniref:Protoporphyrinogen IX oxidase n=1 Tax=Sphingomonas naasensis TaxID=1344951 RepID=A0A4V3QVI1_9SPHN|nr:CopD family protein [Sphingomonas naasensis]NIJ21288.1 putative membrane protein [Sphingomonas naasensis]TGX38722.1 CopD family protein [Sphingomonas naasensis]
MTGWLGGAYLWVKAAHIIFVIYWMAGLFLLPRYLVHHQEALGTPEAAGWEKREALLRRMILGPSIGIVWLLGIALALNVGLIDGQPGLGWLHAKLLLVFALSGYQGWAIGYSKKLAKGAGSIAPRRLRLLGEVPALAVIFVVILAVVKPF